VCARHSLWLHVDAAYGWPAVLIPEGLRLLAGIERADSITLDPHKWFAQTYEAGCVLIRDGRRLATTFQLRPDYMQDVEPEADEINFADHGIALTRRFRALKIWLSVKLLGVDWFRSLVRRGCDLARYAEALLRRCAEVEILSPASLGIVAFRLRPSTLDEAALDELNLRTLTELRTAQVGFLSSTRLEGRVAMRMCFVNWRTTAAEVEEIVGWLTK
jgi:glutamate/tyrosine decarboxylase-like PLP-dependent enzyme